MHNWGDEGVDWEGINDAAYFIASNLKTWGRIGVTNYKEKFGTVRVYCHFGACGLYPLWRPSHIWYPKWWPMRLDFWLSRTKPFALFQTLLCKWQVYVYKQVYKRAVQKWPHLYKEIVSMADYGELFEGVVPGYKHSDYWRTYNGNGECEVNEETDSTTHENAQERADVERARQRYEGSTAEDYKDLDQW